MKIETQTREDHQVRLVVEVEPESMEKFKRQAARQIAHEAKIPGFRPGKAPYDIVRRLYGDETITKQAVELMVDEIYPEVITQSGIKPGGPGSLDQIISMAPPTVAFLIPLESSVELGDFYSIRQDYTPPEITDQEVEDYIQRLLTNYATVEPVDRPVEEKDLVYLTASQTIENPSEGQDPDLAKDSPMQFIIPTVDEEKDEKYPFPGFGRQLLGMAANDERLLQYTFPEDAEDEKLRGKTVDYAVKVQSVKSMKLPDLNDEFVQTLGDYPTVDAFKQSIKERLQKNASEEYEQSYSTQLVDKVRVMSTIKYSPQALEDEIEEIAHQLERDLARQNMDMDTYLKYRKIEKEKLVEEEIKPAAIRRLERSLVINEVGKAEKIQLNPQSLQGIVSQTMKDLEDTGELKKLRRRMSNERVIDAVMYDAASHMMNNQVIARLKEIATGHAEKLTPLPENEILELASISSESETSGESETSEASTGQTEVATDLSIGTEESSSKPTLPESEA